MNILISCIIINAFIGVIFKLFAKYNVNILQGIVVNYFTCLATASVILGAFALPSNLFSQSWIYHAIFLGFLFINAFNILAKTVSEAGVMATTIFQKMSLVAPTIAAVIFFAEPFGVMKFSGIILALLALILIQWPAAKDRESMKKGLIWLIITFLSSCIIDTYLYFIEANSIAPNGDIHFVASLFFFAGCLGMMAVLYQRVQNHVKLESKSIVAGILLGIPNFFSIYLLLLLLANDWEGSVVFPINNIGILTLSSIIGILFFKEAFSILKLIGFVIAISAILLIMNATL